MTRNQIHRVDLLSAALTIVFAVITIYVASFPVVDTIFLIMFVVAWPFAALLWAITLLVPTMPGRSNQAFRVLAAVLLTLAVVSSLVLGIFGLLIALLVTSATLTVYAVVERGGQRRLGWLISPAIVIATVMLLYANIPRLVRIQLAEPGLTAFAEQVRQGQLLELPWYGGEPVSVEGIPIYEAYLEGSGVEFVTAYTGFFDDYGAGLAYMPYGPPDSGGSYQHLSGPWYRWGP